MSAMLPAMNRENFRLLLVVLVFFTLLMVLLVNRPMAPGSIGDPFAGPAPSDK
jgi:hypothetical protein